MTYQLYCCGTTIFTIDMDIFLVSLSNVVIKGGLFWLFIIFFYLAFHEYNVSYFFFKRRTHESLTPKRTTLLLLSHVSINTTAKAGV